LRENGLTHSLKKDKSQAKKKRKADAVVDGSGDGKKRDEDSKNRKAEHIKSTKADISARVSGINNAMTASLTAKVLEEQEERNKRRKLAAAR